MSGLLAIYVLPTTDPGGGAGGCVSVPVVGCVSVPVVGCVVSTAGAPVSVGPTGN